MAFKLRDTAGVVWDISISTSGELTATVSAAAIPESPVAASVSINGQGLLDLLNANLGGYRNAISEDEKLKRLNEGKDEVWAILRSLQEQYFITYSQNSVNSDADYFGDLSTTVREYTLPADLMEIKFIECVTPGYEHLKFEARPLASEDFQSARRVATESGLSETGTVSLYIYSIVGKDQLVFAQFPEATLTLKIWYVRALPDFELAETIDEILFPYSKKIAEYAAKRIVLALQDEPQYAGWEAEWKESVQRMVSVAAPRASTFKFVEDFLG